jgi:hypothetical protein
MFLCLVSCKFKNIRQYFSKFQKISHKKPPPLAPLGWELGERRSYHTAAVSANGQGQIAKANGERFLLSLRRSSSCGRNCDGRNVGTQTWESE